MARIQTGQLDSHAVHEVSARLRRLHAGRAGRSGPRPGIRDRDVDRSRNPENPAAESTGCQLPPHLQVQGAFRAGASSDAVQLSQLERGDTRKLHDTGLRRRQCDPDALEFGPALSSGCPWRADSAGAEPAHSPAWAAVQVLVVGPRLIIPRTRSFAPDCCRLAESIEVT